MPLHISIKLFTITSFLGLSSLLFSGCVQQSSPIKVTFKPIYENIHLSCNTDFIHYDKQNEVSESQKKWQYQQIQFFLHGVEIKTKKNGWQPWAMTSSAYQSNNVALLGEACSEKREQSNWQLLLEPVQDSNEVTDIRFTLGIPFELNHLNPLTQPSPLNDSSMFWGWQGGHKFMRIELNSQNDDFLFHLGSTGCKALSPVRAPKSECLQPNRVEVTLPFTRLTTDIEFDLAVLFNNLLLTRNNNCQSAVDEESCKVLFDNLRITAKSDSKQMLFKAK
jgi:uncharacterized repeat protein (TIGR04052 family)